MLHSINYRTYDYDLPYPENAKVDKAHFLYAQHMAAHLVDAAAEFTGVTSYDEGALIAGDIVTLALAIDHAWTPGFRAGDMVQHKITNRYGKVKFSTKDFTTVWWGHYSSSEKTTDLRRP